MITMLQGKYLTVTQAADAANCTVSYVRQLLRANKIQGEKAGERAWMVPVSEVPKIKKTKSEKSSKSN
jgi:excisionase family DNA binding protein